MNSVSRSQLNNVIEQFKNKNIIVLGDLILDVYLWGNASKMSPEAPVPVVHIKKTSQTLGGAANVMRNLISLGANVAAFGIAGKDEEGETLLNLLSEKGIDTDGVITIPGRPTTVKKRLMAAKQQLARIDYEDTEQIENSYQRIIVDKIIKRIEAGVVDAIIFEDYAKGLLTSEMVEEITKIAKDKNIILALDPHPSHLINVKGLTLITPNRLEAFSLAGVYHRDSEGAAENDSDLKLVSKQLKNIWDATYLLITLGPQGMALFADDDCKIIPTKAREVFDVSGAGDTVISMFVLALLGGATPEEATEISNHAAGIVVGKLGTVSITLDELHESFPEHKGGC
jgi:D-beta-D-heptose 7-phosphate kinase/D-beta-D-heptose 1-phosphate adenosyltransferase